MNDVDAKKIVEKVFSKIYKADSIDDLVRLLDVELSSQKMDPKAYPKIEFSIASEEIEQLVEYGMLDEEGNLDPAISSRKDLSPLSKLLYSVLWKNGDLKKIHNVVKGISTTDNDVKSGIVFYQFGRYLKKEGEPIVDQHILRSFAVHKSNLKDDLRAIRKKDTTISKDWKLINLYRSWLGSESLSTSLRNFPDYVYYIDQVLFSLGRKIKLSKKRE